MFRSATLNLKAGGGFTRVEFLVVIAITGVLVALQCAQSRTRRPRARRSDRRRLVTCVVATALLFPVLQAKAQAPAADVQVADARAEAVKRGLSYLRDHGQADDGTFSIQAGSGLTALAVTAALRNGVPADEPMVANALKALEAVVKPDGGIYSNGRIRNYETCFAIVALNLANKDDKYDTTLADADKFVRGLQYGAAGDKVKSEQWYGGVGYGGPERPDLSNTAYPVEALAELEAPADDEAI